MATCCHAFLAISLAYTSSQNQLMNSNIDRKRYGNEKENLYFNVLMANLVRLQSVLSLFL